jgi:hypothetical protein
MTDAIDAARYRKLRMWMSMNQKVTWDEVCRLAAVGCYVSDDEFDLWLDGMKDINVIPIVIETPTECLDGDCIKYRNFNGGCDVCEQPCY